MGAALRNRNKLTQTALEEHQNTGVWFPGTSGSLLTQKELLRAAVPVQSGGTEFESSLIAPPEAPPPQGSSSCPLSVSSLSLRVQGAALKYIPTIVNDVKLVFDPKELR